MEAVEGDKVSLQQPHKEHEVDAIMELRLKLGHLQVHLVQMSVHKVDERLQQTHTTYCYNCTIALCRDPSTRHLDR